MADPLRPQLCSFTGADVGNGVKRGCKPGRQGGSTLKGRKGAAKYQSKKDPKLTWAGRGATPRWMREEIKGGKLMKEASTGTSLVLRHRHTCPHSPCDRRPRLSGRAQPAAHA
jgi:hypothetical protein